MIYSNLLEKNQKNLLSAHVHDFITAVTVCILTQNPILESFKLKINNQQEAQSFENSIAYNSAPSK